MFPSPSLGPPLLSASWSPAPGPCGMPLAVDVVPDGAGVVAGALVPVAVAEFALEVAAGFDEFEPFDPHAARPSATRVSRPAARRRARASSGDFVSTMLLSVSYGQLGSARASR